MAIKYGQVVIFRAYKGDKVCKYCEQPIEYQQLYVRRIGRIGPKYFSEKLHINCFHENVEELIDNWRKSNFDKKTTRKPGEYNTVRKGMDEQTKLRRKTLLYYLNVVNKRNLIKAYKEQRTQRIYTILANSYRVMVELHAMGVEFPRSFINKPGECQSLIMKHDSEWYNSLMYEDDLLTNWKKFLRTTDSGPQPKWDVRNYSE